MKFIFRSVVFILSGVIFLNPVIAQNPGMDITIVRSMTYGHSNSCLTSMVSYTTM